MHRLIAFIFVLAVFAVGCGQKAIVPAIHSYDLFGGRYFVEIQTVGSFDITSQVENKAEGDKNVKEFAEYKWGGNDLRLDQGKLTFNGEDCGLVKKGDRVLVDKDGLLSVNGKRRP